MGSKMMLVNPQTAGMSKRCNNVLVSIVATDALVQKHQAISIHITDLMPFVPKHF